MPMARIQKPAPLTTPTTPQPHACLRAQRTRPGPQRIQGSFKWGRPRRPRERPLPIAARAGSRRRGGAQSQRDEGALVQIPSSCEAVAARTAESAGACLKAYESGGSRCVATLQRRRAGTLANAQVAAGVRAEHSASASETRDEEAVLPRYAARTRTVPITACTSHNYVAGLGPLSSSAPRSASAEARWLALSCGTACRARRDAGECAGCRARAACGPVSAAVFVFARARPSARHSVNQRVSSIVRRADSEIQIPRLQSRSTPCRFESPWPRRADSRPVESSQSARRDIWEIQVRRHSFVASWAHGKFRSTGNVIGPQGQLSTSGNPLTESRSGSRERT
ncbi:hypothetical protein B0H17DRAFT_1148118 [Mycena rosella]|uniref:Uncharacterized protein n=1 Tax=Mycena rosella TaxID=1033263 RepID=A0AAD7CGY0_MYCRO|nr:hypothetical protein B0H17DRAFT_1148118 [Mycena rosella]